jgi:hypothetical protein
MQGGKGGDENDTEEAAARDAPADHGSFVSSIRALLEMDDSRHA